MSQLLSVTMFQSALKHLGYYAGNIDGDYGPKTERAVALFQGDYPQTGGVDGDYGAKTDAVLRPLIEQAEASGAWQRPPDRNKKPDINDVGQLRRFRLTRYWIEDAAYGDVPMLDPSGRAMISVSPASFKSAALEGTIFAPGGELLNVAERWIDVSGAQAEQYRSVYELAERAGWIPDRADWAGIMVIGDVIVKVRAFDRVAPGQYGYPTWRGIDANPFRTMATDTSIIPSGAWAFIPQLVDIELPDGSKHDGWVRANDVGSAIEGVHIDLFVGHEKNKGWPIPNMGDLRTGQRIQLWSPNLDQRIPITYTNGLV